MRREKARASHCDEKGTDGDQSSRRHSRDQKARDDTHRGPGHGQGCEHRTGLAEQADLAGHALPVGIRADHECDDRGCIGRCGGLGDRLIQVPGRVVGGPVAEHHVEQDDRGGTIVGRGRKNQGGQHPGTGHSHGAQFVDLEVDAETGVVRVNKVIAFQSCGRVVSRKTAESQIIGAVIQGLSYALFENKILDRTTGAMVNPNLEMYKILGAADMPHIQPILWEKGQTGVRALGEPPVIPTAGATACAVFNAIGTPVRHLPLTPDKLLAALAQGKKGGGA